MTSFDMGIVRGFEGRLDTLLRELPCFTDAQERILAPMLPGNFILAQNYLKSFPQHAVVATNTIQASQSYLLSPTCCYPVFHALQNTRISGRYLVTHKNLCFRCEEYYHSGYRQISFLMREYIFLSPDLDDVETWIKNVKQQVGGMIGALGLELRIEKATDPFFNANDYKQKFQEAQNLKSEFIVEGVAVGSVNLHLKAFSRSCNIRSDNGDQLYSACFGLGYDRTYQRYKEKTQDDRHFHPAAQQNGQVGAVQPEPSP